MLFLANGRWTSADSHRRVNTQSGDFAHWELHTEKIARKFKQVRSRPNAIISNLFCDSVEGRNTIPRKNRTRTKVKNQHAFNVMINCFSHRTVKTVKAWQKKLGVVGQCRVIATRGSYEIKIKITSWKLQSWLYSLRRWQLPWV